MTELLGLLSLAKDSGFEVGSILTLGVIYFRVEANSKKRHKEMREENSKFWQKLIDTVKGHDEKNETRFKNIEDHIGLKK